jgi:hypothetical protein
MDLFLQKKIPYQNRPDILSKGEKRNYLPHKKLNLKSHTRCRGMAQPILKSQQWMEMSGRRHAPITIPTIP